MQHRLTGLIAATPTPFRPDGAVNPDVVARIVDHLEHSGVSGIYICGSTGEGPSLSSAERREMAEAYLQAARGRMKTVVQVGHNSLREAQLLAEHAAAIGADAVSATAPSYFQIDSVDTLIACMAEIAEAAPHLPFYYYHIPAFTGAALDMAEFLAAAESRIGNLVGLKYTAPQVHEYQACLSLRGGRFDVLWGCDEMLLSALVVGARGAIGSTYNVAAPLYRRIVSAFEAGELAEAQRLQSLAVQMVRVLLRYPLFAALKWLLGRRGIDCGGCRLPQRHLSPEQCAQLETELERIGFFDWSRR